MIFPENCLACNTELTNQEKHICLFCKTSIKKTYFEGFSEASALDKVFWGRIIISNTYAHFYFESNTPARKILHELKYKHKPNLGVYFGEEIGKRLIQSAKIQTIDALIPVPLHHKKAFDRGYNQSEMLAKGIGSVLNVPVLNNIIQKISHTSSQTKKNKISRWDNVSNIFESKKLSNFKHVAIIDDVITTGSTTESLALELKKVNPTIEISIIALAFAK